MFDLATDTKSQQLIREFYEAGKVVSAVCHGPAALVNVKLSDGSLLIKDQPLTAFSNAEEDSVDLSKYSMCSTFSNPTRYPYPSRAPTTSTQLAPNPQSRLTLTLPSLS